MGDPKKDTTLEKYRCILDPHTPKPSANLLAGADGSIAADRIRREPFKEGWGFLQRFLSQRVLCWELEALGDIDPLKKGGFPLRGIPNTPSDMYLFYTVETLTHILPIYGP